MAGPHEVALGIASILGKANVPNPLMVSFRGQSLESAAEVVNAIISECVDADIGIAKIELDRELHGHITAGRNYSETVRLVASDDLTGDMRIFAK
jgi:hypothetical protein